MVHKKYICIGGKTYGPYYYESYREGNKIKKRYISSSSVEKNCRVKVGKSKKAGIGRLVLASYFLFVALLLILTFFRYSAPISIFEKDELANLLFNPTGASYIFNGNMGLAIWDDSDEGLIRRSNEAMGFYANYTDALGTVIDDVNGDCNARYNYGLGYGAFEDMTYNSASGLWASSESFNYVGEHLFGVVCSNSLGEISLENNFIITNTPPRFHTWGLSLDGIEDMPFVYNFSANVSDADANDILNFVIEKIDGPLGDSVTLIYYKWISINSQTGVMKINATQDWQTGIFIISVFVRDVQGEGESRQFTFRIGIYNDAPVFFNLSNQQFNNSVFFNYSIFANDEENNTPLSFKIDFLSCAIAPWSSRTNCELFNDTQYLINNTGYNIGNTNYVGGKIQFGFTPTKNDVGIYQINFSVQDLNNLVLPYNASSSKVVNFTVINVNDFPYFRYVCDNERTAFEDVFFSCYINATDTDELKNLTFNSSQLWFLNSKTVGVNATTSFNGSIWLNFTPSDRNVGNWDINITVRDTGFPTRRNTTAITFLVNNIQDAVDLKDIRDIVAYTTNYYKIYVNASDDDLLIPDKNLYNESISFSSNFSCVSVTQSGLIAGTNISYAVLEFDTRNSGCFLADNLYAVNISVMDLSGFLDSDVFIINASGNYPPVWRADTLSERILLENTRFYWNLSYNVSDSDGPQKMNFTFSSDSAFPSFNLNISTGVINFTPSDIDVGEHFVVINASDGATVAPFLINFTVYNQHDNPAIQIPIQGNGATIDPIQSNIDAFEDSLVDLFLFVQDGDLAIPDNQKNFYNEGLNLTLNILGRNPNLFGFNEPSFVAPNKSLFLSNFVARKSDVGLYNVSINIIDASSRQSTIYFNLTITEINHPPLLINLTNQSSRVNGTLYYDLNASDIEDGGEESGKIVFNYTFLSGTDFINHDERIFNSSTGVLNITFNDFQAGRYLLRIRVNDSTNLVSQQTFWIFVYDYPLIILPDESFIFNLTEGVQSDLFFLANHSVRDTLNYTFFLNGEHKDSIQGIGNGSELLWQFKPDFDDETYGEFANLTLVASIPIFSELNTSRTWNINISHENSPLIFIKNVGDKQANYDQVITINLSEHFFDWDAIDPHYNQTIEFIVVSSVNSSAIASEIDGWSASLRASGPVTEILSIIANELDSNYTLLGNATSNSFTVVFTEPSKIPTPVPSSGGGGGGGSGSSREKPILLKLILPDPVSVREGDNLILPIQLVNEGTSVLKDINLSSFLAKNGVFAENISVKLSKDFFSVMNPGDKENLSLALAVGLTDIGIYEITINANVRDPKYSDWGKIYISVEEGETIMEKLLFTQELVASNPECIELKEIVDESREYLRERNFASAEKLLEEAVNSCKKAISQQSLVSGDRLKSKLQDRIFIYLLVASIIATVFGALYYLYQRNVFWRALKEADKDLTDAGKDLTEVKNL